VLEASSPVAGGAVCVSWSADSAEPGTLTLPSGCYMMIISSGLTFRASPLNATSVLFTAATHPRNPVLVLDHPGNALCLTSSSGTSAPAPPNAESAATPDSDTVTDAPAIPPSLAGSRPRAPPPGSLRGSQPGVPPPQSDHGLSPESLPDTRPPASPLPTRLPACSRADYPYTFPPPVRWGTNLIVLAPAAGPDGQNATLRSELASRVLSYALTTSDAWVAICEWPADPPIGALTDPMLVRDSLLPWIASTSISWSDDRETIVALVLELRLSGCTSPISPATSSLALEVQTSLLARHSPRLPPSALVNGAWDGTLPAGHPDVAVSGYVSRGGMSLYVRVPAAVVVSSAVFATIPLIKKKDGVSLVSKEHDCVIWRQSPWEGTVSTMRRVNPQALCEFLGIPLNAESNPLVVPTPKNAVKPSLCTTSRGVRKNDQVPLFTRWSADGENPRWEYWATLDLVRLHRLDPLHRAVLELKERCSWLNYPTARPAFKDMNYGPLTVLIPGALPLDWGLQVYPTLTPLVVRDELPLKANLLRMVSTALSSLAGEISSPDLGGTGASLLARVVAGGAVVSTSELSGTLPPPVWVNALGWQTVDSRGHDWDSCVSLLDGSGLASAPTVVFTGNQTKISFDRAHWTRKVGSWALLAMAGDNGHGLLWMRSVLGPAVYNLLTPRRIQDGEKALQQPLMLWVPTLASPRCECPKPQAPMVQKEGSCFYCGVLLMCSRHPLAGSPCCVRCTQARGTRKGAICLFCSKATSFKDGRQCTGCMRWFHVRCGSSSTCLDPACCPIRRPLVWTLGAVSCMQCSTPLPPPRSTARQCPGCLKSWCSACWTTDERSTCITCSTRCTHSLGASYQCEKCHPVWFPNEAKKKLISASSGLA
jgi:hypothetical protein